MNFCWHVIALLKHTVRVIIYHVIGTWQRGNCHYSPPRDISKGSNTNSCWWH